MPIGNYIPAKETQVKILSTVITGAGMVTSAIGASNGSHALTNVGAACALTGSLIDDVPESWLKERANRTYTQMLKVLEPNIRYTLQRHPDLLSNFDIWDVNSTEDGVQSASLIRFFGNNTLKYEIARIENFPALLNTLCTIAAFTTSARDPSVGIAGGLGVLLVSARPSTRWQGSEHEIDAKG